MGQITAIILTSFSLTFIFFPFLIKALHYVNVLESPCERKVHTQKTPSMGGLAIFLGFTGAIFLWFPLQIIAEQKYLLGGLFFMMLLGLRDDLTVLRARQKLIWQLLTALMLVNIAGVKFSSLYGLFGIAETSDILLTVLSIFTLIVITNAFNLIDGIDGLAGCVGALILTILGSWFYLNGDLYFAYLQFALAGALIAFLNFNWEPSKIFMGDTGSLIVGFLIAVSTVRFIDANYYLMENGGDGILTFNAYITTAMAVLILPLFDTIRVFTLRVSMGKSPLDPDKNHIHHILLDIGCNHSQASLVLFGLNIYFVALAFYLRNQSDWLVFALIACSLYVFMTILKLYKSAKSNEAKGGKVLSLFWK